MASTGQRWRGWLFFWADIFAIPWKSSLQHKNFFLCKQTWKALNLPQNGDIVNILGDVVTFDNLLAVSFPRHVSKNAKDAVVWWIQKLGYGDSRLVFPSIVFGRQHLRSSKLDLEHLSKRVSEWQIVDDALSIQRLDFAAQGAFSSLLRLIFQV